MDRGMYHNGYWIVLYAVGTMGMRWSIENRACNEVSKGGAVFESASEAFSDAKQFIDECLPCPGCASCAAWANESEYADWVVQ